MCSGSGSGDIITSAVANGRLWEPRPDSVRLSPEPVAGDVARRAGVIAEPDVDGNAGQGRLYVFDGPTGKL